MNVFEIEKIKEQHSAMILDKYKLLNQAKTIVCYIYNFI